MGEKLDKSKAEEVEKDKEKETSAGKDAVAPVVRAPLTVAEELQAVVTLVERAVPQKESRLLGRALRQLASVRRRITLEDLVTFGTDVLPPDSDARVSLSSLPRDGADAMEVGETATGDGGNGATGAKDPKVRTYKRTSGIVPELEILVFILGTMYLLDHDRLEEAKSFSAAGVKCFHTYNRRTLDLLGARLCTYYSLAYEKAGVLAEIRPTLLALHRTATLRHDSEGQETLLNLLLRNYLQYALYEQAEKLRSKAQRPESQSNNQFCRYLFYLGRIRAIQLEYTDAKECLMQAGRKAPEARALGFRIACVKWAVIVRMLLGEIPERTIFTQPGMRRALVPYFDLTQAVRIGNLEAFHVVSEKQAEVFKADHTFNLIVRLRQNVIRAGLRRINLAYSCISLSDIARKLRLDDAEDTESIVAKAIRDGGIDATIDHSKASVSSKESFDIYSTQEPMTAFHSRVAFCLNIHNEAVRAMRFPPDAHKRAVETDEQRRERLLQEQELAQHMAEEDGDF